MDSPRDGCSVYNGGVQYTKPSNRCHLCFFCDLSFTTVPRLVQHLDQEHEGWIDYYMERNGFGSPVGYPVMEYRYALAELMETEGQA